VCDAGNVTGFDDGATELTATGDGKTSFNSSSIPAIHFIPIKKINGCLTNFDNNSVLNPVLHRTVQ
jgi:hypothetical protein